MADVYDFGIDVRKGSLIRIICCLKVIPKYDRIVASGRRWMRDRKDGCRKAFMPCGVTTFITQRFSHSGDEGRIRGLSVNRKFQMKGGSAAAGSSIFTIHPYPPSHHPFHYRRVTQRPRNPTDHHNRTHENNNSMQ